MIVVICPGIHPPELTDGFVAALEKAIATQDSEGIAQQAVDSSALPNAGEAASQSSAGRELQLWMLPSGIAPYGPDLIRSHVLERWQQAELPPSYPTAWIGFSAGVVGAVVTARRWQREGGLVKGLIAVDGWGVPLGDRCPRFRLGHDRFTAQSCEWLGASDGFFYCDPALGHLDLWRSPQQSWGHWQPNLKSPFNFNFGQLDKGQSINAVQLLAQLLRMLA